jgi:hypothetical protein
MRPGCPSVYCKAFLLTNLTMWCCSGVIWCEARAGIVKSSGAAGFEPSGARGRSTSRRSADAAPPPRNRWFVDSPLEGAGFELSVPFARSRSL